MFPGVRPSIILASLPTAATAFWPPARSCRTATTEGSFRTMPCPRTKIRVLAVPRSMDRTLENMPRNFLNIGEQGPSGAHARGGPCRSEEHTSELHSRPHLVCRLLLEKKKKPDTITPVNVIVGMTDPALSTHVIESTWLFVFP